METPKLAVVFGTYNRLELLKRAILSVRNAIRTDTPYEIVAVDGGSTDGSRAWLAEQPDVVLIGQRGELTGAVRAFNLGFAYAVDRGIPFVAHLNDDAEIVTPDALSIAIQRLELDADIGEVAFAYNLNRGDGWGFDHVNGKTYANYGVIRREAGTAVARAQGDATGRAWWNPIYTTYGADSEFGVWLWKLGWTVEEALDLRVHDANAQDTLRVRNEGANGDRRDSRVFWERWRDEVYDQTPPAARPWSGLDGARRVFVTGGHGFLGSQIVRQLDMLGKEIIAPPRADCNFRHSYETSEAIADARPDLVIHCAAHVGGIGANQADPVGMFVENMAMGVNVLAACRRAAVSKVVLVGTTCSYPRTPPMIPFREEDLFAGYPEETNAPYGVAKRSLFTLADAYRRQHGMNIACVVPANLYGPGDDFSEETSHVIPAMIRKFVDADHYDKPTVTLWGTGAATREFLFVGDAADGILAAADAWSRPMPINHGSDGNQVSIADLATIIAGIVGWGGTIEWDRTKPDGQPRRALDSTRARQIGWHAGVRLLDGLKRTVEWYRETYGGS